MIATINPATGETIKTFPSLTAAELESKLALAASTYLTYRRTPFAQRADCLTRAAQILESEKDTFGRLMTLEMGKTIESARQESAKCALACRYYAEHGERLLAPRQLTPEGSVRYQPIGPVLAVMPWNFPFWQVFRFAAPALIAGNVGLLKHASNVPQCALAIEDILRRAGFPEGAFQTLLIESKTVQYVIADPRVKAVTLTGSEPAGREVASQAGSHIKKTVLELGGSDPFVVMPSADLDAAVRTAVTARCINNGQSCIAAKRFIVHRDIYPEFERRFVEGMSKLKVGDPMDESTQIGPLATPAIAKELDEQVRRSRGTVLLGGHRINRPGNFYAPTVLTDVHKFDEELFGPVAILYRAAGLDDAIRIANDTPFGLGASVWTRDAAEQARFTDEIESGMVFVNAMVASDPRLPFGGAKTSGYGRELADVGLYEFLNVKTVAHALVRAASTLVSTHPGLADHLAYTAWATRRLLDAVAQIPADHLTHDFQTSDRTILGTLVHTFAADRVWLKRVLAEPITTFVSDADHSLSVLQQEWPATLSRWQDWARSLQDPSLVIHYRDMKGNPYSSTLWEIVLHVVNHGTHHRGQVSGFLRTLGHTPPQLDLIRYYREAR